MSARLLALLALVATMVACAPPEPPSPTGAVATRIVSLAPHLTELVYAAGAGDKLVATIEYSDYPPEAELLPRIGHAFRIDFESLALLEPDLVLAWSTGTSAENIRRLRELNYRVVAIETQTLDDVARDLLVIGELAGTDDVARLRAAEFRAEIDKLRERYQGQSPRSVFFQISLEPLYTVTGSHIINDVIELCGGANIFAELGGVAPPVSVEAVIAAQPDVILGAASPGDDGTSSRSPCAADPSLPTQRDTAGTPATHAPTRTVDLPLPSSHHPRRRPPSAPVPANDS